jgi:hypothetical protein
VLFSQLRDPRDLSDLVSAAGFPLRVSDRHGRDSGGGRTRDGSRMLRCTR